MRSQRGRTDEGVEGEIDEAFWATAAQAGPSGDGADDSTDISHLNLSPAWTDRIASCRQQRNAICYTVLPRRL